MWYGVVSSLAPKIMVILKHIFIAVLHIASANNVMKSIICQLLIAIYDWLQIVELDA